MQPDPTRRAPDSFATITQAARARGIGHRQIRRAVAAGELTAYGIGGWMRVRIRDVDSWLETKRIVPPAESGA